MAATFINVGKALRKLSRTGKVAQKEYTRTLKLATLMTQAEVKASIAGQRAEPTSVNFGGFLNSVTYIITAPKAVVYSPLEYAKYLEYGTSPHFVRPKNAQALHWSSGPHGGGTQYFSKGHMVSGIMPRRHFRNTAKRVRPRIIKMFMTRMKAAARMEGRK